VTTAPTTPPPRRRWRTHAACRGTHPALFYDADPGSVAEAKQVCAGCPVRGECATHACAAGEEHGVWGGLAPDERDRPAPRAPGRPGPAARVTDDDLRDIFDGADPDRPALAQLLARLRVAPATAYKYLDRAQGLGLVEHRGRGLYPTGA
jgi:WhiB family redox-sensing transcriptional regulator